MNHVLHDIATYVKTLVTTFSKEVQNMVDEGVHQYKHAIDESTQKTEQRSAEEQAKLQNCKKEIFKELQNL
ncbi:MAG: hypothetical protein IJ934_05010 [Acetobacter sp.]|nr:hypothetical protein [Acetobacter sp.]